MGFYDTYLCEECLSPKQGKGCCSLEISDKNPTAGDVIQNMA